jgi:hypothetical protein
VVSLTAALVISAAAVRVIDAIIVAILLVAALTLPFAFWIIT